MVNSQIGFLLPLALALSNGQLSFEICLEMIYNYSMQIERNGNNNLHDYFNLHVCPLIQWRRRQVPLSSFQFLQAYDKVSLTKVGWYVLRVKYIHSWSPQDPLGP